MNELIIIRGVPGTGKSTKARGLIERDLADAHFEADQYFVNKETGAYEFDATKLRSAHKQCIDNTEAALKDGLRVVVSNTFTTASELLYYYRVADACSSHVTIITLTEEYGSIHGVPEDKMDQMRKRLLPQEAVLKQWRDYRKGVVHGI
jgi:predicted kinase